MENEKIIDEVRFKTFPVRMSMKMNSALREKAFKENISVHQLILKAIGKELTDSNKAV